MSATTTKLPLARARQIADALVADLAPGCERICVAGSVRRMKQECGDVEIVAIPRRAANLYGEYGDSLLDPILDGLVSRGLLRWAGKNGKKYKQFFTADDCKVDLFLTTPEQFGLILMIRTGPAEFSKRLVTPKRHGGLLPDGFMVRGGWIVALDSTTLAVHMPNARPMPEEADMWKLLNMEPVRPEDR